MIRSSIILKYDPCNHFLIINLFRDSFLREADLGKIMCTEHTLPRLGDASYEEPKNYSRLSKLNMKD